MKKFVIIIAAIITAIGMTACSEGKENYELEDFARYELTYEQALEEGYTDEELDSYMRDYAIEHDIHVNKYFIEGAREGRTYKLVNENGHPCTVTRSSDGGVLTLTAYTIGG